MAQIVYASSIFQKIGCMDPLASNYDPTATEPCNGCCEYGQTIVGCRDPLAVNYNSSANSDCDKCCIYQYTDMAIFPRDVFDTSFTPSPLDLPVVCEGPYQIAIDGQVLGVTSVDCCNITAIGPVAEGHEYYWDGKNCYYRPIIECPSDIVCVDCNNFDWWNDTYIVNHEGQSLQTSNPVLWQHLVDVVTNSGQTFYTQISTGNLLDINCCPGVWDNGVCFCNQVVEEDYEPKCINTLQQFLDFYSTTEGYNYLVSNATSVGGGLGLTNTQFNFVLVNLFNSNDNNGNGVSDLTEARLLITNALSVTGGFYVNFGDITNNPIVVTKGICDSIGGYWDTSSSQCMCQPVVDQCEIDITQVQVVSTTDFYNNPIQIVSYKDKDENLSEACCNKLIKDYNLPWEWQSPWCYQTPKDDCLPVQFSLNNENMTIPTCSNSLELSMWVYFGKPANPCQPIPDPPDDDIIVIDGEVCDITLTPNTGVIVTTGTTGGGIEVSLGTEFTQRSAFNVEAIGIEPVGTTTCCYSIFNPILARITTTNPLLNTSLVQVKEYNSSTDYFDKWVQIKATLPTSGLTLNFGIYLEIYQGLNCCCNYDIFIDDIRVDCPKDESLITYNNVQCPGFEITRVIDNKKSWVYNPGTPLVGISEYDNIEREDGDFGMLNGEGNINRTFAPSLDADIPWRYTDYWTQSSVLERHSNLVLNSKELGLTFDMCADCPISGTTLACPSGYTLSAGTTVCYNITGTTPALEPASSLYVELTSATTEITVTYLNLYDLENYKKTFQSFWIPFMEQFIPATTIWVAGERWCNEPCTVIDVCDYDFELTEAEISIEPVQPGFLPSTPRSVGSSAMPVPTTSTSTTTSSSEPTGSVPTETPYIMPIKELGLVRETVLIPTTDQLSVDLTSSRFRFSDVTTEIVAIMGFLCNKKEEEKVVSLTLIKENVLLSDLGLSNVYNINPSVEFCSEVFRSPEFIVSGAVELVSGLTSTLTGCTTGDTAVYNFDYTPTFDLNIIITGGTDYTGYTGNLCYKLFDGSRFITSGAATRLVGERLNSCTPFSAITSTTITQSFTQGSLPNTWGEYLMRFYYTFVSKDCNVGYNFNTWSNTVQLNTAQSEDRYFITVVDPPKPILPLPEGKVLPNYVLVSEKLLFNGVSSQMSFQAINGNLNYWILGGYPLNNEVLLTINGITLKQSFNGPSEGDFQIIDNGWGTPKVVEVFGPIEGGNAVKPSDIVVATYINAQPNSWPMSFERYFMDTILIDGFTFDDADHYRTPGDNTINVCSLTLTIPTQQMFTTRAINSQYSIKIYVNGVALTENREFFLSSFDGRINFNPDFVTLREGDIVGLLAYSKPDNGIYDYGTIDSRNFTVNWSINEQLPSNVTGYFNVRLYDEDSNLLLFENPNVPYSSDQVNYFSSFTNLSVNVKYKIEVEFKVNYYAKMNNNVSTCSFAYGYFNTNNPKLLYST